jgi:hypothetical protein
VAGKSTYQRGMEEAPEKGKESLHSAHANGTIMRMFNHQLKLYMPNSKYS